MPPDDEILYMTSSADDLRLGLCLGRRSLLKVAKVEVTSILVFHRRTLYSAFELEKARKFSDKLACITFAFSAEKGPRSHGELLFATQKMIYAWNYMDESRKDRVVQRYLTPLDSPNLRYVKFSERQDCAVIVSDTDAAFVKIASRSVDKHRDRDV